MSRDVLGVKIRSILRWLAKDPAQRRYTARKRTGRAMVRHGLIDIEGALTPRGLLLATERETTRVHG